MTSKPCPKCGLFRHEATSTDDIVICVYVWYNFIQYMTSEAHISFTPKLPHFVPLLLTSFKYAPVPHTSSMNESAWLHCLMSLYVSINAFLTKKIWRYWSRLLHFIIGLFLSNIIILKLHCWTFMARFHFCWNSLVGAFFLHT